MGHSMTAYAYCRLKKSASKEIVLHRIRKNLVAGRCSLGEAARNEAKINE
jgi:hypothetical protein